jgi:hypothetical protein
MTERSRYWAVPSHHMWRRLRSTEKVGTWLATDKRRLTPINNNDLEFSYPCSSVFIGG